MPYLDDVLNPYQSLTGDLTPEDTLTGLLSEDGLLQGAIAISDVVGVTELTELTDVSITNPLNNDVLTYNDVTEKWENMPAQGGGGGTSDYDLLDNKPSINSVTLSGNKTTADLNISYNDLDDKPVIPAAQVNSDWNASSGVAEILNKPTIPTELDDLSNVDTTGVFNGAVLTYISNDDKWEAFSVPQQLPPPVESLQNVIETTPEYAGQVLKLSHGTPVTKWTNDYVSYNELTDRPTIPDPQVNSDWNAASGVAEILNKPTLATVATSGDYADLSNTPDLAFEDKGTISDLNNVALDNGGTYKYVYNAGAANKPGTGGGTLLHFWNAGNHAWGAQLVISDKGLYFRNCNNSTFGSWNTIVSV